MDKGLYHLILRLGRATSLPIGKLGTFSFPPGYYVYTGSALNNLQARINRHRRRHKKLRWHIDYLRCKAELVAIRIYPISLRSASTTAFRTECLLNQRVQDLPGAQISVPGFGSSDCRCRSHLTYFQAWPTGIDHIDHIPDLNPDRRGARETRTPCTP